MPLSVAPSRKRRARGSDRVLVVRAPMRISLAGGGTDLPAYYERHGGFVVSTSIDKYFYVFATPNPRSDTSVQISSSDYQSFYRQRADEVAPWSGQFGLVSAALDAAGRRSNLSLFLASEVPPGTGLGSSSTVAVGLVKALAALNGQELTPAEVAERACDLELGDLAAPIGKQDQYAAAFGGLNAITFTPDGVLVEPLHITRATRSQLQRRLMLFFTGGRRSANSILQHQQTASRDDDGAAVASLHAIKAAAFEMRRTLEQGDLGAVGEILHETWQAKKRLASGISTPQVDEWYDIALRNGAVGGKIAGAGGGGFLMLYCEEAYQENVIDALESAGMFHMDFRFETGGAQVLLTAPGGIQ